MSWFSLYCASIMSLSTVSEIPSKDVTFVWQDLVSIRLCWLIFIICFLFNSLWDNFNFLYFYRLNGQTNRPTDGLLNAWIELTNIGCSSCSCCKSWIWVFSVDSLIAAVVTPQAKPPSDDSSTSCCCRSLAHNCLGSAGCVGAGRMLRSLTGAWETDGCLGAWDLFPFLRKSTGSDRSNSWVSLDQNCWISCYFWPGICPIFQALLKINISKLAVSSANAFATLDKLSGLP